MSFSDAKSTENRVLIIFFLQQNTSSSKNIKKILLRRVETDKKSIEQARFFQYIEENLQKKEILQQRPKNSSKFPISILFFEKEI